MLLSLLAFYGCRKSGIDVRDHSRKYPTRVSVPASETLGVVWEEIPGNPRMEQPPCPAWNCFANTDPWVEKNQDGQWILWFSSGGLIPSNGGFLSIGPVIGRAIVDKNLNMILDPENDPVLTLRDNVWDKYRETVSLHWLEGEQKWLMWYLGYQVSFFDDPAIGQIYSLDSEGKQWGNADAPIYSPAAGSWDYMFLSSPRFVEISDNEWRLYYTGAGTTVGIGILISYDRGATWEPHPGNPVFTGSPNSWDEGILGGTVKIINGKYMMWYSGYKEPLDLDSSPIYIGLAISDDGINWERSKYNPVTGPSKPGKWNDIRVVSPHIIMDDDGSLLMFAHGQNMKELSVSMGKIGIWRSPVLE